MPALLARTCTFASRSEDKALAPFGYELGAADEAPKYAEGVSAANAFCMPVFYLICATCFFLNIGMYVCFMIPSICASQWHGLPFAYPLAAMANRATCGNARGIVAGGAFPGTQPLICARAGVRTFFWAS